MKTHGLAFLLVTIGVWACGGSGETAGPGAGGSAGAGTGGSSSGGSSSGGSSSGSSNAGSSNAGSSNAGTGGSAGNGAGGTNAGGSGGGLSGETGDFACFAEAEGCIAYHGPVEPIPDLEQACEEDGGTVVEDCPEGATGACVIGNEEAFFAQVYYIEDAAELEAASQVCALAGGTWETP
jgi:hypothetical protein